jgi:hypothetical protein
MAGGERLEWLDRHLVGPRNRRLAETVREAVADGDLKPFPADQLVITLQTAAVGVINLAPLLRASFGVEPDTPAARAAHEVMIVEAVLGGFLTEKSRAKTEERP